jgi:hypothetical protein
LFRVDLIKKVTSWEMPLGNNKSPDFFKPLTLTENSKLIEDTTEEIQNLRNFFKLMLEFNSMSKVCYEEKQIEVVRKEAGKLSLEARLEKSMEIINLEGTGNKLPKLIQWDYYTPKVG